MNLPTPNNLLNFEISSNLFNQTLLKLKDEPHLSKKLENVIGTYESHLRGYFQTHEALMFRIMNEEIEFKRELNRLVLFQKFKK